MLVTDPQSTFAIFAEVSAALAGFSDIVVAFGRPRGAAGALTALERRRLSNLFLLSGFGLLLSLLGMALLHVDGAPTPGYWRFFSALVLTFAAPWLIADLVRVSRLKPEERQAVSNVVLVVADGAAVVGLALQVLNLLLLGAAWPVFVALTLAVAGAFQQFILLVWSRVAAT